MLLYSRSSVDLGHAQLLGFLNIGKFTFILLAFIPFLFVELRGPKRRRDELLARQRRTLVGQHKSSLTKENVLFVSHWRNLTQPAVEVAEIVAPRLPLVSVCTIVVLEGVRGPILVHGQPAADTGVVKPASL